MKKSKLLKAFIILSIFLLSGCAALDSSIKEIESDVTGLERIITVYDNSGKVIGKYEGRARIIPSDYGNKVIFELMVRDTTSITRQ